MGHRTGERRTGVRGRGLTRFAAGRATLLIVSVMVFAGTELLPGDVAEAILGQQATPEAVAAIREELELDRPALVRYWEWLSGFLHGDLGRSLATGRTLARTHQAIRPHGPRHLPDPFVIGRNTDPVGAAITGAFVDVGDHGPARQ